MKKIISLKKRKKILKLFKMMLVVFILVIIGICIKVDAGVDDSNLKKNRVNGIYAVTNLNGVDRIFYLNMYTLNDRISYCIEIGVDIGFDVYNSTSNFYLSKLSYEQFSYIRKLTYFGYGYYDHFDYRYYMAVQELIWESLSNVDVEWTNELNINGSRIDIDKYKEEILYLVNDYSLWPDLRGYFINMEVKVGDSFFINDINKKLKYFDVISSDNIKAEIIDNSIKVDIGTDFVGSDSIYLRRKKVYDYDSLLYYKDNSQKLISNGNINEEMRLDFVIGGYGINLEVVDNSGIVNNQNSFDGIKYELYSNGNDDYYKIFDALNAKDMSLESLSYGNYCVKQIETNDAYKLNSEEVCFEYNSNTDVIYLYVEPVLYDLEILKLFGDDNLLVEEGALFYIYNNDGSLYQEVVTDNNGMIKLKLPYGKYKVVQGEGIPGYLFVDDFFIDASGEDKIIDYTLVNKPVYINLVLNSVLNNGELISDEDIFYKIYDVDNGDYVYIDGSNVFNNLNGKTLIDLKFGNYVIEVVNNSLNYKEQDNNISLKLDFFNNYEFIDNEIYFKMDINYDLKMGSIKLHTYKEDIVYDDNKYSYEYIEDDESKYQLIVDEDIIINNNVIYKSGDVINSNLGNLDIIDNLYMGKYCLVNEINSKCFYIKNEDIIDIEIKDELDKGNVIIHNIDNNNRDLIGSGIEIYDSNNKIVWSGVTDSNGIIELIDLKSGSYYFKQISVCDNYILNNKIINFQVDKDEVVKIDIVNELLKNSLIEVPNTFGIDRKVSVLIIMIFILSGGFIYKIKFSRNR